MAGDGSRRGRCGRAVGDHDHLLGIDGEARGEADPGGLGHHHDRVGPGADLFEHELLVGSRRAHDRVRDDDHRDDDAGQRRQDVGAVESAVEAVLVLDDGHISAVEHVER